MAATIKAVGGDPKAEHYQEICDLAQEAAAAQALWQQSKLETKDRKEVYDELSHKLLQVIRLGPDWQKQLEFGED